MVGSSNELVFTNIDFDSIDVKWIESYAGMTMSFISDIIYDKYYVYEKALDNYELICETEDFQVTLDIFKEGNYYFVEGYKKDGSGYYLSGISKMVKCKRINFNSNYKKISIVVPVYNSEKFLCRCIDSVLISSFNDIELILVDDGSSDKSPEILDWYHQKYGEVVKVIHKMNGGVSTARNVGIETASCEYIAFLDNDDYVHPNMYEKLYSEALKNNLDVVICPVIIRDEVDKYRICLNFKKDNPFFIYDYDKMISEKIKCSYDNIFFVAIWNKIMRTEIVKSHLFFNDNYYEDTAFTSTIYSYINCFGFYSKTYYVWDKRLRKTVGTATNNYDKKNDSLTLNKKYCDALFYCVYYGNPLKIDVLVYDSIKEAIEFSKEVDIFNKKSKSFDIYRDEIRKVSKMYDLKSNPYFQVDKELYEDVMKILS